MIEILIHNSYSSVKGLSPTQDKGLRRALSYEVGANTSYYTGGYGPTRKSLVDKQGMFPSGLVPRAEAFLASQHLPYRRYDKRRQPPATTSQTITAITPYPAQQSALQAAIRTHRGIISMPTGTGKSLVIAMIAAQLNLRTLVIVPSLEIQRQLTADMAKFLPDPSKVIIRNIDSTKLKKDTNFDVLVIDEAHHSAARSYQRLNKTAWKDIYYRFFMSATPFRTDPEETILFEGIAGELIYKLDYKTSVASGYIVPVEAYYLDMPKTTVNGTTWAQVYSELVVRNDQRNTVLAALLLRLNAAGAHTLCLVKEVAHGDALVDLTGLQFANGKDEETRDYIRQFNNGELKTLVGTTGILGEGVNTRPCEYVIVAGLGKAKGAFLQQVGRAVRTYPGKESAKVIIIRDSSHKWSLKHYREQCKILKEEFGIVPQLLEIE